MSVFATEHIEDPASGGLRPRRRNTSVKASSGWDHTEEPTSRLQTRHAESHMANVPAAHTAASEHDRAPERRAHDRTMDSRTGQSWDVLFVEALEESMDSD